MSRHPKIALWISAFLCLFIGFYVYANFDPLKSQWFPRCLFLTLTGLKCPGCGSQRVFHSLLNGDVRQALGYNALLVILLPYIILLIFSALFKNRCERLYSALSSPALVYVLIIVTVLWWILRNVFNW
mgnify:FL=1